MRTKKPSFRINRNQQEPVLEVRWGHETLHFGEQKKFVLDAGGCFPIGAPGVRWEPELTRLVRQFVVLEYLGAPNYKFKIDEVIDDDPGR